MAKKDEKIIEETIEVKLKVNIKYGNSLYIAGEKVEILEKDLEEFKAANVIEVE